MKDLFITLGKNNENELFSNNNVVRDMIADTITFGNIKLNNYNSKEKEVTISINSDEKGKPFKENLKLDTNKMFDSISSKKMMRNMFDIDKEFTEIDSETLDKAIQEKINVKSKNCCFISISLISKGYSISIPKLRNNCKEYGLR